MKYLLFLLLLLTAFMSFSANAETVKMFEFEHREDFVTAQENTGKDYPEISEFRMLHYIGTHDIDTGKIIITKSFANGDPGVIPIVPVDPPATTCNAFEGTTKAEVDGLLTRINNFYKNRTNAEAAFAWGKAMFAEEESILLRVAALRVLIYGCPE